MNLDLGLDWGGALYRGWSRLLDFLMRKRRMLVVPAIKSGWRSISVDDIVSVQPMVKNPVTGRWLQYEYKGEFLDYPALLVCKALDAFPEACECPYCFVLRDREVSAYYQNLLVDEAIRRGLKLSKILRGEVRFSEGAVYQFVAKSALDRWIGLAGKSFSNVVMMYEE